MNPATTRKALLTFAIAAFALVISTTAFAAYLGRVVFNLSGDKANILDKINNYAPGSCPGSAIGRGLEKVEAELASNGRQGVPALVVILSDGKQFTDSPKVVAQRMRENGALIWVTLFGTSPNSGAFSGVAASTDQVKPVSAGLSPLLSFVSANANVQNGIEIVFLVDDTEALKEQLPLMKSYMKDLVNQFTVSASAAHVALYLSGTDTTSSTTKTPLPLYKKKLLQEKAPLILK